MSIQARISHCLDAYRSAVEAALLEVQATARKAAGEPGGVRHHRDELALHQQTLDGLVAELLLHQTFQSRLLEVQQTSDGLARAGVQVVSSLVEAELRLMAVLDATGPQRTVRGDHPEQEVPTIIATAKRISAASHFSPFFAGQLPYPDGLRDGRRPVALFLDPQELEAQLQRDALPPARPEDSGMEEDAVVTVPLPEVPPTPAPGPPPPPATAPPPAASPPGPPAAPPRRRRVAFSALDSDDDDDSE